MKPTHFLLLTGLVATQAMADIEVTVLELQESRSKRLAAVPGEKSFGDPDSGSLSIELLLTGPEVEAATHVGEIKLTEATDDTGQSLVRKQGMSFGDGFDEINREHMWFMSDDPPKDKIKVQLDLKLPQRKAGKLSLVAGSLGLRTAESKLLTVEPKAGTLVEDPLLTEAGAKVSVQKVDAAAGTIELKVEGGEGKLGEFDWVNGEGESLVTSRRSSDFGKTRTVQLDTLGKSAEGAKLTVQVYTKVTTEKVPFRLENLELP